MAFSEVAKFSSDLKILWWLGRLQGYQGSSKYCDDKRDDKVIKGLQNSVAISEVAKISKVFKIPWVNVI